MPKFLVQASYTVEGTKGLLKSGGSSRRKAVEELLASVGGTMEAFYFTFGEDDAIVIMDVPSNETALSIAMTVRASGMVTSKMIPLVPIEEVDRATKRDVHFRPPGA
ncbi:MAG: GYD domain-containing protein [Candidatus Eremiobacteraeota bacterium]|nr:GYD domain-containing protein [Candidatus Eremiobacteraeota bacterium]